MFVYWRVSAHWPSSQLPGRLPRTVTAYPGFEDFCDAVQAEAVNTSGEAWQAVSDECKAWLVHGPGNSCGGVFIWFA